MTIKEVITEADRLKHDLTALNNLWTKARLSYINEKAFTEVEFSYIAEHIGGYVEKLEYKIEQREKLDKIDRI